MKRLLAIAAIAISVTTLSATAQQVPNPFPTGVALTDCSGTITAGTTAQAAIAAFATIHGFTIANIDTSAGSGEPLWISLTTTAAPSTVGSIPLAAPTATTFANTNSTYTTPVGLGSNHAVSIIGATTGHKFTCFYW